jgi:hypothetical protein
MCACKALRKEVKAGPSQGKMKIYSNFLKQDIKKKLWHNWGKWYWKSRYNHELCKLHNEPDSESYQSRAVKMAGTPL